MRNSDTELITKLRNEIRQDMKDYKLLHTDRHTGTDLATNLLFEKESNWCLSGVRSVFANYLDQQIDNNLTKLIEVNNNEK